MRPCRNEDAKPMCLLEAVRHERAVPAYGSFLFRDDLKPSPTGTSPCSHGAETCLDDAMSMEATLIPPRANSRGGKKKKKKKKKRLDHDDGSARPISDAGLRVPECRIPETC